MGGECSAAPVGWGGRGKRGGRIPQESRGVSSAAHTRGCAACRTGGPLRTVFTGGPVSRGRGASPLSPRRKIRPPGASRRRATDIHVTLLPYRYQSRRHNTARRARTTTTTTVIHVGEERRRNRADVERENERKNEKREGGEIILYFSYEPVRYVSSSVRQRCRVHTRRTKAAA